MLHFFTQIGKRYNFVRLQTKQLSVAGVNLDENSKFGRNFGRNWSVTLDGRKMTFWTFWIGQHVCSVSTDVDSKEIQPNFLHHPRNKKRSCH